MIIQILLDDQVREFLKTVEQTTGCDLNAQLDIDLAHGHTNNPAGGKMAVYRQAQFKQAGFRDGRATVFFFDGYEKPEDNGLLMQVISDVSDVDFRRAFELDQQFLFDTVRMLDADQILRA